jgi:hypothetical protein
MHSTRQDKEEIIEYAPVRRRESVGPTWDRDYGFGIPPAALVIALVAAFALYLLGWTH